MLHLDLTVIKKWSKNRIQVCITKINQNFQYQTNFIKHVLISSIYHLWRLTSPTYLTELVVDGTGIVDESAERSVGPWYNTRAMIYRAKVLMLRFYNIQLSAYQCATVDSPNEQITEVYQQHNCDQFFSCFLRFWSSQSLPQRVIHFWSGKKKMLRWSILKI